MKGIVKITTFGFIALLTLFIAISCGNNQDDRSTTTANNSTENTNKLKTRAIKHKIKSKSYYYKSLASFAKGQADIKLTDLASLEGKKINLVVLYEASAPWAEAFNGGVFAKTGDDNLNGLMESYQLEIIQQFAIDDDNEGIVMEPQSTLANAVETAREISLIDQVLMVHVKEVPLEDNLDETADR